ncbi:protein translocase subunit SecD [Candidatus Woesebacteria bacterium]|nr:protein translocase subunit SecD [Candidatus Woesebacteria bacterium]
MSPLRTLLLIVFVSLLALFVAIPQEIPVKFQYGEFSIDQVLRRPDFGGGSQSSNLDLKLGLDLAGGSHIVFEADTSNLSVDDEDAAMAGARDTIERRVNLFGVSESLVSTAKVGESRRIIVELPGVHDTQGAISLIGQTARLDFREFKDIPEATLAATLATTESTGFTGADFKRARPDFDANTSRPIISFETKSEGAEKFGEITTRLVGQPLIIFLDDVPVSAPVVQTPITGGSGQISGDFTNEETRSLSNLLNSGALPVPISIIEQRTVEASLGAESVRTSVVAGVAGLGMVLLFMILYYGRLGVLASVALIIYGILTVALYKLIPVVLTLPGVAGFILSLGIAVDANILIFERMKEELRAGKSWENSMEAGFRRAWVSIRDASIASLIAVFILLNPLNLSFLHTSGPVRGFALTLGIGVFLSLFTGIFVTRTLLRVFSNR